MIFTDNFFVGDLSKATSENTFSTGQKEMHLSKQDLLNTNISDYYQRRIKNYVKHLWWSYFQK